MPATAPAGLAKLREPFKDNEVSTLPKPYKKDSAKGNCRECGGYHGLPAMHLSYVGHAALTARLLDADPQWAWEPLSINEMGLPSFDGNGGLWIRLTVCGVTRLGYGDAQGKTGPNAVKEAIGDALRNAGMRFGAALDLWHKGDLRAAADDVSTPPIGAGKPARDDVEYDAWLTDFTDRVASAETGDAIRGALWVEAQSKQEQMTKAEIDDLLGLMRERAAYVQSREGAPV